MSTIYILWLRQIKRQFRSKARMLSYLGQPLLFLLALGFGFSPIYQKAGGGNYLQFIAPGVIIMGVLFMAIFSGIEIIFDRQFGFLKETLVAPVPRFHIMIGRTIGSATVSSIQGLVVFFISLLAGFRPSVGILLLLAPVFLFLVAFMISAFGTMIGSLFEDTQAFPIVTNFITMPLFFLSGSLFPLDGLPKAIKVFSYLDPLSYGVDGLRATLAGGGSHFGLGLDFLVLSLVTLIVVAIGSRLFSKIQI